MCSNWHLKIVLIFRRGINLQRKAVKDLKYMFESTSYFDSEQITSILMVIV